MTPTTTSAAPATVRQSITVNASVERAFTVFTDGIDSWWPREHHIGKSPMKRIVVEPRPMGRAYTLQEDGTECDWGTVLVWDPPRRLVFAWQITLKWEFEPDVAKASEVDVRFTPEAGGRTRVDLEHRYLERHGAGYESMRSAVGSPNGWPRTLERFARQAESEGGTDH